MLKIIMCVDKNNGISLNGKLPWNIKEEMLHFKSTTLNSTVVMGHKTYKSIGKLLPNRRNIILSRDKNLKIEGAIVTSDISKIIEMAKLLKNENVFIIGGKQINNLFIDFVDEIVLSRLKKDYHCDLFWTFDNKKFNIQTEEIRNDFQITIYARCFLL